MTAATRGPLAEAVSALTSSWLQHYHRHSITLDTRLPDGPSLFVSNHGFGGVTDLNVLALDRALSMHSDRPTTFLVHQIAWTLRAGRVVEAMGGRRASRREAELALEKGHHVAVFPGGDIDASKSFRDRDTIKFSGRTGYARLAMDLQVPLVPVVTAGTGETLLVLSDGQGIARRLGVDRRFRVKALPISLSTPWGLNVGMVGMTPYFPWPAKLSTAVMPALYPGTEETEQGFAGRVETAMQTRLHCLRRTSDG